mmetsp:Transcript_16343/g.27645  ORF Transcript_16343/g.27645 Transcript_16343/m.27645 type:complete len:226 (+) Transcript_16343:41-718(+)
MASAQNNQNEIPKWQLYLIMAFMLIFGTCNTVFMKSQDETMSKGKKFNHPFFQCANMFIGELTCLIVYFLKRMIFGGPSNQVDETEAESGIESEDSIPLSPGTKLAKQTKLKTSINPALLAIPATFDICGSTLMFIALTQCAASVYQMMRGFIVVITAGMAFIFLGKKQYSHHIISLFVIVAAVAIVGLVGILHSEDQGDDDGSKATTSVLGVLLLLIAQCFTGG